MSEPRLSILPSWGAGVLSQTPRPHGTPPAFLTLLPGHQKRSSHLNRLQTQRGPYSPGLLVFHLHLGGRECQEVPSSQSDKH